VLLIRCPGQTPIRGRMFILTPPTRLFRQLHDEVLVSWPAPSITCNAADQPLTIAVDFDERFLSQTFKGIGFGWAALSPKLESEIDRSCKHAKQRRQYGSQIANVLIRGTRRHHDAA
jgi:hypothetical protein